MHPELSTLYNLQLADTHLQIARKQIQALDWGETQQKAIAALRTQAVALAAEKAATDKALRESERQLAEVEQRIKRSEGRVSRGEIHNEHELESTERELQVLHARQAELEDQALALMETAGGFPVKANSIRAREQSLLKEHQQIRQQSTERKAQLEAEIAQVTARREDLAAKISPAMLKRYDHLRAHAGGVAVVRIVGGVCDSCRIAVSNSDVKAVLETPDLIGCTNCGRYLYTERE